MAQTIEDVNDRTLLQQFHSLYKKQDTIETNIENVDAKVEQEKNDRQTADLSINSEIQALKDQIDSLGVLFTYKGEVATIQDLPATGNKPGDVYYVDSDQSGYIWLEKSGVYQWEQFGPAIDLSQYAKQEDLDQTQSELTATDTQVKNNTTQITNLTNTKQDKLTAGTNITIDENNVISASGGSVPSNVMTLDSNQTLSKDKILYTTSRDQFCVSDPEENYYGFIDNREVGVRADGGRNILALNANNFALKAIYYYTTHYINFPHTDGTFALTSDIDAKVPDAPNTDGTYTLKCVVSNGGTTKNYQWVLDN